MNKNFQSDLTEAFSKLNRVPLTLFPSDKNPDNDENPGNENIFYIYIKMTSNIL
jgi:hypothetical protein